jgi:beta-N-acetylhexosaminidase
VVARAFICGLSGTELSEGERAFLCDAQPWGVILFKRNVAEAGQIRRLCAAARDALGREDAAVLIDQEGGRVQRIGPPILRQYPAGAVYGALYAQNELLGVEAAYLGAQLIAQDLLALGINVDCVPCLDIPVPDGTPAIGDRGLGGNAGAVCTLGAAQIDGLISGGAIPVIKHMPGHGRAVVDSHHELPRVKATLAELDEQDFAPFRLLAGKVRLGMTCHVVFTEIDPDAPATLSSAVVGKIIRERIGFDGALMTDDISMGALSGGTRARAGAAIRAGCDLVLHCNGELAEMAEIAAGVPELSGDALRRTNAALVPPLPPMGGDRQALEARFDALLAKVAEAA